MIRAGDSRDGNALEASGPEKSEYLALIIRRALGPTGGESRLDRVIRSLYRRLSAWRGPDTAGRPELIHDLALLLSEELAEAAPAGPPVSRALDETWRP